MKKIIHHPVLGRVEGIQRAELPTLEGYQLEMIGFAVFILVVLFLYHFSKKWGEYNRNQLPEPAKEEQVKTPPLQVPTYTNKVRA